jgi:hypothetical protein
MTNTYASTQLSQTTTRRIAAQVRAGDGIAEIEQHLSDAAHSGPAYAYEVNMFNLVLHANHSTRVTVFAGGFGFAAKGQAQRNHAAWPTKCICLTLCFMQTTPHA